MQRTISVLLLLALLAGCSGPAQPAPAQSGSSQPAPAGSELSLPEDTLLDPYLGAVRPDWRYGLMTTQGETVTEAVCDWIYKEEYSGADWTERAALPVWSLHRQGPGWPNNQEFVALYAEDGGWHTDFIYYGCIASPRGLFVGDGDGAYLLDPENGRELKAWTWEQLKIDNPMDIPWVTGDAYETAQWTGEKLFLGVYDEKALLLDPETDKVSVLTVKKWNAIQDGRWSQPWEWEVQVEDQTVIVTHNVRGESEETRFSSAIGTVSASVDTKAGVPRVYVQESGGTRCAVYSIEGEEIIPVQEGEVRVLGYRDGPNRGFNVQNPQKGVVTIYDWDGNLQFTLPLGPEDYVVMNGALIQITDYATHASYYSPETGDLVREFEFSPSKMLTPYLGGEEKYGLMTMAGEAVTAPVCDLIYQAGYYGYSGDVSRMPVWVLRQKGSPYDKYALAAADGSWRTDFIYSGCAPTPYGIFAGKNNDQEFVWVDAYTGTESRPIPQAQYGMGPGNVGSWPFSGYARYGSQWDGESLCLEYFDSKDRPDLVHRVQIKWPGDGCTPIGEADWEALQDARSERYWSGHQTRRAETVGDTVYIRFGDGEDFSYTLAAPVSELGVPLDPQILGGDYDELRVLFSDYDQMSVVCTLEGEELLYSENGGITLIGDESFLSFAGDYSGAKYFCRHGRTEVELYDWDGNSLCKIPRREGTDAVTLAGQLLQITDYETFSAYYNPETGEKIAEFSF